MQFPSDNEYTYHRYLLGRNLFFNPILSKDSSISCASCHIPSKAFSGGQQVNEGVGGLKGNRNAPGLLNVGYAPYFNFDGGVPSLEMQVLVPIQEEHEFNTNILTIAEKLNQDTAIVSLSYLAYNRPVDAFVITRALGVFQRTLISNNSRYDQFLNGNSSVLSLQEVKGKELFFSPELNCGACHSGPLFTSFSFENNGIYKDYEDAGRYRITGQDDDWGKFKVPTLRNIALTSPYMHDGSFNSLEEVLAHYNSGGHANENKNSSIQPLNLSIAEQEAVVAFLKTLTDTSTWKR